MSKGPDRTALVADIGGTNARFGLATAGGVDRIEVLPCADYRSLGDAARAYLEAMNGIRPRRAALAVAGPVQDDRVEMTNHVWDFSARALRRDLGLDELRMLNDFAALALAVPALCGSDLRQIKPGTARPRAPIAVLGPGTGLGVAALVPDNGSWIPLTTEGGHRDLAATSEREWRIVRRLHKRFGRVSVERALSGPGLVNLRRALTEIAGGEATELAPSKIVAAARDGSEPASVEAVALFSGWLGAVAGDLALTYGAHGGVYLGGGMLSKMGDVFDSQGFARRFVAKGRFREYLEPIPVYGIIHPYAALIGAARAL